MKTTIEKFLGAKVYVICDVDGWTAAVDTETGWYELPSYFDSKRQLKRALFWFIVNHRHILP